MNCAKFLSGQGFRVYGTSRDPGRFPAGLNFTPLTMDVTDPASVKAAVAAVLDNEQHIDVVINNAGYALMGALEETSEDQVKKTFDTNVIGVFRLIQEVLPSMRAKGSGHIMAIGSIGGHFGLPFRGIYTASKAALGNMLEALQYEVEPFGIKITLFEPGDVKTSINDHRDIASKMNGESIYSGEFEKAARHIHDTVTHGMDPSEISEKVLEALLDEHPAFRYVVGNVTQRLSIKANQVLPNNVFRQLVRQYMKLDS